MGATLERMGGEEGMVPERSEWFRSRGIIGTPGPHFAGSVDWDELGPTGTDVGYIVAGAKLSISKLAR